MESCLTKKCLDLQINKFEFPSLPLIPNFDKNKKEKEKKEAFICFHTCVANIYDSLGMGIFSHQK